MVIAFESDSIGFLAELKQTNNLRPYSGREERSSYKERCIESTAIFSSILNIIELQMIYCVECANITLIWQCGVKATTKIWYSRFFRMPRIRA